MSIIEVKDLSKTFITKDAKVEALKNINFSVEAGDIYGIIGMSGAGKSTLVRCLNFLEVPTEGTVTVEGQELGKLAPKELRKLYYPYHSRDPAQAIERILEGNGSKEEDYTEKGVRILREILEREKKENDL